jgi:tRNA A-37 threonylcarbamoyl transferase component Bud32
MNVAAPSGLAPDPVLPQRDLLLDSDFVAGRLAECLARQIQRCTGVKVKYRVGESLRVLHRITVAGQDHLVAARTFPLADASAARVRLARFSPTTDPEDAFLDASINTIFWKFPSDPKMGDLKNVVKQPETVPSVFGSRWKKSEVVAYAPEKCATLRCMDGTGTVLAYAKVYAGDQGKQCARLYGTLAAGIRGSGSPLEIPRIFEYIENCGALLLESIPGMRLDQAGAAGLPNSFSELGSALAWLHNLPPRRDFPRFHRLDPERLQNAAFVIGLARPDVAGIAARIADELCASYGRWQEPLVYLHGDVHPKNGVLRGGRLVLIDLDQAGLGPAAADLGSMCAALRYNRCTGQLSDSSERELKTRCLEGYSRIRELPHPHSLDWHTAAALLAERALRAVNRVRPEGLSQLCSVLNHALQIVRGKDTL